MVACVRAVASSLAVPAHGGALLPFVAVLVHRCLALVLEYSPGRQQFAGSCGSPFGIPHVLLCHSLMRACAIHTHTHTHNNSLHT